MPITLTATPAHASANSYATLAEADALALTRIGAEADAWVAATGDANVEKKKRALITATRDIDTIPSSEVDFVGDRATDTQRLQFPRTGDPDDTPVDELPENLVDATIELAILYFSGIALSDPLNIRANDKKKVQSGDDSVEWFEKSDDDVAFSLLRFPAIVQRLLWPLLVFQTVSTWGSSTAIRMS